YTPCRLNGGEVYTDEDGEGYGFGWGIVNDPEFGLVVSHSGGMPGLDTWFERFIGKDRVLLIFNCRDPEDARAFEGLWNGLRDVARDREPAPVKSIEDIAVKEPDRSNWESFCGWYEHSTEDEYFIIDEVFMKEGELYASAFIDGDKTAFRLYPIGENEFGRKRGMLDLKFGDGCLAFDGNVCKKL
ncbi:MAG: hypothetical protein J5940_07495, partial [Clostridia bacterium]|nr:hypothetical protein [Clostridia bacterium]